MNPEIKAQWVAALRSGKYKQGRGQLRSPEHEFCCLGVLCDIKDPTGWREEGFYEDESSILPWSVVTWADLGSDNPAVVTQDADGNPAIPWTLAEYNDGAVPDGKPRTFIQIADMIDQYL